LLFVAFAASAFATAMAADAHAFAAMGVAIAGMVLSWGGVIAWALARDRALRRRERDEAWAAFEYAFWRYVEGPATEPPL
jgi:hypothetical protein